MYRDEAEAGQAPQSAAVLSAWSRARFLFRRRDRGRLHALPSRPELRRSENPRLHPPPASLGSRTDELAQRAELRIRSGNLPRRRLERSCPVDELPLRVSADLPATARRFQPGTFG